jgi:hypothetical protein
MGWSGDAAMTTPLALVMTGLVLLATVGGESRVWGAEPATHSTPTQVREATEKVLSDPRFQRTRPDGSLENKPPDRPERPLREPRAPSRVEPRQASGISEAILWVVGGIFAAGLLLVLAREIVMAQRRRKRKARKVKGGTLEDLVVEVARKNLPASLQRARELAAEGRFDEAAHVLLMSAMGYLHALAGFSLEPAFTSREVLDKAPLDEGLKASLGELVAVVEVSLFGFLPVDADDFGRCERSFLTLHDRLAHDG